MTEMFKSHLIIKCGVLSIVTDEKEDAGVASAIFVLIPTGKVHRVGWNTIFTRAYDRGCCLTLHKNK